jgi:hypothetical protein
LNANSQQKVVEALECHNLCGNEFGIKRSSFGGLFLAATAAAVFGSGGSTTRPCL